MFCFALTSSYGNFHVLAYFSVSVIIVILRFESALFLPFSFSNTEVVPLQIFYDLNLLTNLNH